MWKPLQNQLEVIRDVYNFHKHTKDKTQEILLSGNVGSAKSTCMAHIIVSHCLRYPNAQFGIGRRALPRLKETLALKIREHISEDLGVGMLAKYSETRGSFSFSNGSRIVPFTWSDKNFKKFRSYELSGMAIEELTENPDQDKDCYFESIQRVGRRNNIPERVMISACNPGAPSSVWYKHFYSKQAKSKKVYEFRADDNPYLPAGYIESLREILDPKEAQRMLDGKWIEIGSEVIYYAYDRTYNYRDESYKIDGRHPIYITFDFNIGTGKPLSLAMLQHIGDETHVFNEVVIEGQRTIDALDEAYARGLLPNSFRYIVHGDSSGRNRDTRSRKSDYELIENFLSNINVQYKIDVPTSNPLVRSRHNLVNGRILNANGKRGLFIYKEAPTADEGFRLTSLKTNGSYIEDDSKRYQHITTAIGYSICQNIKDASTKENQVQNLSRFGLGRR
jgi:hypothetical protein